MDKRTKMSLVDYIVADMDDSCPVPSAVFDDNILAEWARLIMEGQVVEVQTLDQIREVLKLAGDKSSKLYQMTEDHRIYVEDFEDMILDIAERIQKKLEFICGRKVKYSHRKGSFDLKFRKKY